MHAMLLPLTRKGWIAFTRRLLPSSVSCIKNLNKQYRNHDQASHPIVFAVGISDSRCTGSVCSEPAGFGQPSLLRRPLSAGCSSVSADPGTRQGGPGSVL